MEFLKFVSTILKLELVIRIVGDEWFSLYEGDYALCGITINGNCSLDQ